jgi:hypothetical protein
MLDRPIELARWRQRLCSTGRSHWLDVASSAATPVFVFRDARLDLWRRATLA